MKLGQTRTDGGAPRAEGPGRGDAVWLALMSGTLFLLLLPASSYIAARPIIGVEWGLNNTQAGILKPLVCSLVCSCSVIFLYSESH